MEQIVTRFFRAGVGTVIYNQKGEVALFQRAQFPVGSGSFSKAELIWGRQLKLRFGGSCKKRWGWKLKILRKLRYFQSGLFISMLLLTKILQNPG